MPPGINCISFHLNDEKVEFRATTRGVPLECLVLTTLCSTHQSSLREQALTRIEFSSLKINVYSSV
jgi:hypothetical protein